MLDIFNGKSVITVFTTKMSPHYLVYRTVVWMVGVELFWGWVKGDVQNLNLETIER